MTGPGQQSTIGRRKKLSCALNRALMVFGGRPHAEETIKQRDDLEGAAQIVNSRKRSDLVGSRGALEPYSASDASGDRAADAVGRSPSTHPPVAETGSRQTFGDSHILRRAAKFPIISFA